MRGLFGDVYKGRRVLVTGHTGFKGSWLSLWLTRLGAEVCGYSLGVPTKPSNFEAISLRSRIRHVTGDVRDIGKLKRSFDKFSPDIVFHLAAQPIARKSYDVPDGTFSTNVIGTVNVLECVRTHPSVKACVIVTSDKCYQNVERDTGYAEGDRLGGDDPYSASKACAEIASSSYFRSFFSGRKAQGIATARAGNVIGGGDWAPDRIVPDCVRALSRKRDIVVRNPSATRPWQHVLEPLSGYLYLGQYLISKPERFSGEAFNFGPNEKSARSVREVIDAFVSRWGGGHWAHKPLTDGKKESRLLQLCCEKAKRELGWRSVLSFDECVSYTADWYKRYYSSRRGMDAMSITQIDRYVSKAEDAGIGWATGRIR